MSRGRHRKKRENMTTEVKDPKESLGVLASAVALQESGILVRGMTVTDLSTGYVAAGEVPEDRDPFLAEDGAPRFRGSSVGLAQLEMVRELVHDVVEQRRENPEWSQVDTPVPRSQFPWGIGVPEPDVVVAGGHAAEIAGYLRCVGVRARTIDADRALWIASDLAEVEHELAEEENRATEKEKSRWSLGWSRPSLPHLPSFISAPALTAPAMSVPPLRGVSWKSAVGVAAVAVFAIGGLFAASAVFSGGGGAKPPSSSSHSTPLASPEQRAGGVGKGEGEKETPQGEAAEADPWREHHLSGEQMQTASVPRAQVPVVMDLPGWRRAGATPSREEFRSGDLQMRVLVSAKETPLTSQEELDGAVLHAVEKTDGVRVAGRAPVSYEETYPESTTLWHVRFVDGHQVSIGCQFRQVTGSRLATCEKAADVARPDVGQVRPNAGTPPPGEGA